MDKRYMAAQWLGEIESNGMRWRAYETGEKGWVLLRQLSPNGLVETGSEVAVERSNLKVKLPRP
jgi:hypothetical protein